MHIGDVDIKALKSARLLGITLDEKSTLSNVLKIIVTLRSQRQFLYYKQKRHQTSYHAVRIKNLFF